MASSKNIRRENRKTSAGAGGNKTLVVALAGFTALALAAIVAIALVSTSGSDGSGSSGSFTPNDQGLLQPGTQAPEFSTQGVDGGEISLSGSGGEPTLLVFFATWCPHCNEEAPILAELAEENEDLNVVMAGMDGEDNPEKVRQFVEEYGIEGQAMYEPSLGQTYQVTGYPTAYVLDGQGEIVGANAGETPKEVLQGWIDEA